VSLLEPPQQIAWIRVFPMLRRVEALRWLGGECERVYAMQDREERDARDMQKEAHHD
jgi:hypothetical protein